MDQRFSGTQREPATHIAGEEYQRGFACTAVVVALIAFQYTTSALHPVVVVACLLLLSYAFGRWAGRRATAIGLICAVFAFCVFFVGYGALAHGGGQSDRDGLLVGYLIVTLFGMLPAGIGDAVRLRKQRAAMRKW